MLIVTIIELTLHAPGMRRRRLRCCCWAFFRLLVASLMSIYYNLIGVDGGGLGWDAGMVMASGAWVLMVILNIFLTWWTLLQPRQQQRVLQKSKQLLCHRFLEWYVLVCCVLGVAKEEKKKNPFRIAIWVLTPPRLRWSRREMFKLYYY